MVSNAADDADAKTVPPSRRWIAGTLVLTGAMLFAAWYELRRVEQGQLFAVSFSWDAPASSLEVQDAQATAADYLVPAMGFLTLAGVVVASAGPRRVIPAVAPSRLRRWLTVIFLASVVADLSTTLWFFHDGGVDLELHPGIRLFGYAYGRTTGPVAGKLVQAAGILLVSRLNDRAGLVLLGVVTCFYFSAAAYNASLM